MSKWKSVKDDPPTGNMDRYVWVLERDYRSLATARWLLQNQDGFTHWAEVESGVPPEWEEPMPELVRVDGASQSIGTSVTGGWRGEAIFGDGTILRVRHPDQRKAILLFNAVANAYNQALKEIQ